MKQILQSLSSGDISIESVPAPKAKNGHILIETNSTLISAGTERMLLDFGKAGIIGKIKQQPDKVKEVMAKAKTDGLAATLEAVKSKLDQPIPLGYCNVGRVIEIGDDVEGFQVGDRVLSNGAHAEIVRVPKNLCVKIPPNVADEHAAFAVLGAIGLQGIRLLQPTLGECVVVQGLGIIGLMTVQLLIAHGCRVLGVDFDQSKCELAKSFGAEVVNLGSGEDLQDRACSFSRGRGVDAVLITASAKSDDIVHQAATISRKRGRIVLVGVVGLNLRRDDFYEKELSFQVSCSYGPGRYDSSYEEKGQDYPVGYVRWTEQRNFEAVLDMLAAGKIDVEPLISKRFAVEEAKEAYAALENRNNLGLLLTYSQQESKAKTDNLVSLNQGGPSQPHAESQQPVVAFVGAGNYASRMLMPAFKQAGAKLSVVITSQGVSGVVHGKKQGFAKAGTDFEAALQDDLTNTVVIATQHNLHAEQAVQALQSGKHVFIEKPLCMTIEELTRVEQAYNDANNKQPTLLMLGFNRRFSPLIESVKGKLSETKVPKSFIMTVNAGHIPADHWTQDPAIGGGRILGEACHFIDLLRFLAGHPITRYQIMPLTADGDIVSDVAVIQLQFADGSIGTINYFANGHKALSKERLEVFCGGKVFQLDNFRHLKGYGWSKFKDTKRFKQDKGQNNCIKAFVSAIASGTESPIPFAEIVEVSKISIELAQKVNHG